MKASRQQQRNILIVTLLALWSTVLMPDSSFSAETVLKIYKNRKLEAVTLSEIGLSGSGMSAALNPFETDVSWDGSEVETPELLLEQVYISTRATRRDVLLWYEDHKLKNSKDSELGILESAYDVKYRIFSRSGVENALSHKKDSSSLIRAHITEKPVECKKKNKNRVRCFGRVDFDFDISQARRSGRYHGTIEITITTL